MSTLFFDTPIVVNGLRFVYSLEASEEFINCADVQLTKQFINETGIKPGKNVCISISEHYLGAPIYSNYLTPGNLLARKLMIKLFVNHNWNPVTIFWKSNSGKDYKLHDKNIDPDDIVFWFEKLDKELYFSQLYPNDKLPFKTNNFSFELNVIRLNLECSISLQLKSGLSTTISQVKTQIEEFIEDYNSESERKERKYGVIHNSKITIVDSQIKCELDLGSTGIHFFKKLLSFLSKLDSFSSVEIA